MGDILGDIEAAKLHQNGFCGFIIQLTKFQEKKILSILGKKNIKRIKQSGKL